VILSRKLRETTGRGFILVLYDQAYLDGLTFQIVVKTRHDLFECMLEDAVFIPRIRNFPLSVRKDHGVAPTPDLIRGRTEDIQALNMRQVNVRPRLLVVLRELLDSLRSTDCGFGEVQLTLM
jgi:hypothetical protein